MTPKAKISWVLGVMVSATAILTWAANLENPIEPYIINVASEHFASKSIESKVDQALETQVTLLSKFEWLEKQELSKELYEHRKSQCRAETQFQKDYYHQKMTELKNKYRELFGHDYPAPQCREIL